MQLTKMLRMELRMEMVSINNDNIAAQKMMQVTASSLMKMVTVFVSNINKTRMLLKTLSRAYLVIRYEMRRRLILHETRFPC